MGAFINSFFRANRGAACSLTPRLSTRYVSSFVARLRAVLARHGVAQPSQCGSAKQQACPPQMLRIAVSSLPSRKSEFLEAPICINLLNRY
jgi:hypothetical protein